MPAFASYTNFLTLPHKQTRRNDTHQSTSDPEAKLYRKSHGREARPSYMGHAVMENRSGLAVAGVVTEANGTAGLGRNAQKD